MTDTRQDGTTSEDELLAGYAQLGEDAGVVMSPAPEFVAALADIRRLAKATAVEVATTRELVELLVDWAGARDRPPADDVLDPKDGSGL